MVCDSYPPSPPAGPPLLPNDPQAAWILVASLAGSWVLLLLFGVCVHFAEKRYRRANVIQFASVSGHTTKNIMCME